MRTPPAAAIGSLLITLTAACAIVAAEPLRVPAPKMVAALQPFVDQRQLAGAVALVASKDKILCLEAVGYSDVEARTPMRTDNLFWIASMTKSMTTTALMMLVDEGKLDIADPVEKYLPEFKNLRLADPQDKTRLHKPTRTMTVEHLLSHTHGMAQVRTKLLSLQDDVESFAATPLDCEPGTRYKYSAGIDAGARILEKLSGMSYAEFIQRRLFTPLGMKETTFWPDQQQVERLARTFKHKADKSGIENFTLHIDRPADSTVPAALLLQYNAGMISIYKNRYAHASGGLFSTAMDIARFCQMLLRGGVDGGKRYVSEAAIRQMTAVHTGELFPTPIEGYGLGWFVVRQGGKGRPSAGSYGHRGARKTLMWVDPARQLVMILLLQSFDMSNKETEAIHGAFVSAAEAMSPNLSE